MKSARRIVFAQQRFHDHVGLMRTPSIGGGYSEGRAARWDPGDDLGSLSPAQWIRLGSRIVQHVRTPALATPRANVVLWLANW